MPKRIQTVYVCDICDHESAPMGYKPQGWLSFGIGGRSDGSEWREVFLCPDCMGEIKTAIVRQSPPET